MTNKFQLSSACQQEYLSNGLMQVTLPPHLHVLLDDFKAECCQFISHFSGIKLKTDELCAELPFIALTNRQLVSRLYKASRRFPSAKRLACDSYFTMNSALLMNTPFAACCHFVNIRIDLPGEDKFLLPPHQDFPYIQDSLNAVVWWIPFFDAEVQCGLPSYIPGSHKLGIISVEEFDSNTTGGSGARSFRFSDTSKLSQMNYVANKNIKKGNALIFSTQLIHRSEPNVSKLARLTLQARFSDPFNMDSYSKNYPEGLYLGDKFSDFYPEYVTIKSH